MFLLKSNHFDWRAQEYLRRKLTRRAYLDAEENWCDIMRFTCFGKFVIAILAAYPSILLSQDVGGVARPAKVHTVVATDLGFERAYPAIVYPSREVELSFRVSGQIIELPIRASSKIQNGGVIARLDSRDFEAEVARLKSQMDEALANLSVLRSGARPEEIAALEASVQAAQAQVDQAREEFQRSRQLVERGVVSSVRFQEAETALRLAETELVSREQQLSIGRLGGRPEEILAAEAAIRGLETQIQNAKDNLADATLRAPFSGIIARRHVENFSNVQAGEPIVLVQDLARVEIGFDLPGADISAMASMGFSNVSSSVIFEGMPDVEFEAELIEFSTQADAATQTYRGRLSVTPPDGMIILPGMVAKVVTSARHSEETAVSVPMSAVASNPDGSTYVWRVNEPDNRVQRQNVEIGDISEEGVIIRKGLEVGHMVITAGLSGLQEGMAITPVSKIGN